jgi:hypothetical protein
MRWRLSSVIGYLLRIQAFACQQKVELIGGISTPGRSPDRNCEAIRRKLAGQYHCIDGAGTDVGCGDRLLSLQVNRLHAGNLLQGMSIGP